MTMWVFYATDLSTKLSELLFVVKLPSIRSINDNNDNAVANLINPATHSLVLLPSKLMMILFIVLLLLLLLHEKFRVLSVVLLLLLLLLHECEFLSDVQLLLHEIFCCVTIFFLFLSQSSTKNGNILTQVYTAVSIWYFHSIIYNISYFFLNFRHTAFKWRTGAGYPILIVTRICDTIGSRCRGRECRCEIRAG